MFTHNHQGYGEYEWAAGMLPGTKLTNICKDAFAFAYGISTRTVDRIISSIKNGRTEVQNATSDRAKDSGAMQKIRIMCKNKGIGRTIFFLSYVV